MMRMHLSGVPVRWNLLESSIHLHTNIPSLPQCTTNHVSYTYLFELIIRIKIMKHYGGVADSNRVSVGPVSLHHPDRIQKVVCWSCSSVQNSTKMQLVGTWWHWVVWPWLQDSRQIFRGWKWPSSRGDPVPRQTNQSSSNNTCSRNKSKKIENPFMLRKCNAEKN